MSATADAERLLAFCNHFEGLDLPANLEPAPGGATPDQLLFYGEDSLVGILTLQRLREIEVCLAVHPRHRRRGIGRRLLDAAMGACADEGADSLMLVCEERSRSGMAFVQTLPAQYRSSEHRMVLDPAEVPTPSVPGTVQLQPVQAGDIDMLVSLVVRAFGGAEADERARRQRDLQRATHRFYVGRVEDAPVGSLGVVAEGDRAYIVAFGVLPEHRGRGYGRQLLAEILARLVAEGWKEIMIEVAADNAGALSLYQSCGFRIATSYGFYRLPLR